MIVFGLLSSVSGILTFLTFRLGFHASATLSRSGWFIEPASTGLAVMLRPARQPAPSAKATPALLLSSIAIAAITITLPDSPLAGHSASPPSRPGSSPPAGLTAFYVIANEGPNIASR